MRVLPVIRIRSLLVAAVVLAFSATASRADFVGVVSEIRTDPDTMSLCGEGLGLAVCNFYAAFDHPGDKLLNIGNPATVTTTDPNGYFQHAMGGDTASQCDLFEFPLFSDLGCDSFVTIGRRCSDDPGGDSTAVDPSWDTDEFNNNGHLLGGWYAVPFADGSSQGEAGMYEDLRVLIAQFSIAPGETISGEAILFTWLEGTDQVTPFSVELECSPPSDLVSEGNDCPADLNGDGFVGASDLAILMGTWGPVPTPDPPDFDGDGDVDPFDLASLLAAWGPCE